MYIQADTNRNNRQTAKLAKQYFITLIMDGQDKATYDTLADLVLHNPSTDWFYVYRVLVDHFPELEFDTKADQVLSKDDIIKGTAAFYSEYDLADWVPPSSELFNKDSYSFAEAEEVIAAYLYDAEWFDSSPDAYKEATNIVRFIIHSK